LTDAVEKGILKGFSEQLWFKASVERAGSIQEVSASIQLLRAGGARRLKAGLRGLAILANVRE
jgi:hypothetical protein